MQVATAVSRYSSDCLHNTMATIINTLQKIWERKDDFCCLCFQTLSEEVTQVDDEVFIYFNETEIYVPVSDILCTILDYEILNYISSFKNICSTCTRAAINSYTFIKTCKTNCEQLTNAINGLFSNIEYTQQNISSCSTLYIAMNFDDYSSQQLYDMEKPVSNLATAKRRYKDLLKALTKIESTKKKYDEKDTKIKQGNCVVPLKTNDAIKCNDRDLSFTKVKCKECHKVLSSKISLRNHYIRLHAKKKCICTECNKYFESQSCLEAHQNKKHCTIVCSLCGKTFKSKSTFETHEKIHKLKLVCPDCGRVYKNKSTYKKHIELNVCGRRTRASPANAKFTCDYCNKKYTQKVSLRVHIQYEHGNYKYHVCKVCNKKFWAQSRLKAHMVKHTKERNFSCMLCSGKFVTKEALLYHTRIHTGEKPYECPNCDARFLSASRRSAHVRRHHTNATLECEICSSKFNSQNYLQKHKKGHFTSDAMVSQVTLSENVTPEKVNEVDLKTFTQELKRFEEQEYEIDRLNDNEVYHLEFTQDNEDYTIKISAI